MRAQHSEYALVGASTVWVSHIICIYDRQTESADGAVKTDGADNDCKLVRAAQCYLLRGDLHGLSADR